jgi:hypothetical protein
MPHQDQSDVHHPPELEIKRILERRRAGSQAAVPRTGTIHDGQFD